MYSSALGGNGGLMGLSQEDDTSSTQNTPDNQNDDPHGGKGTYNGDITYNGKSVPVKNGMLTGKDGKKYTVSNDGHIVADAQTRQIIGRVENGQFFPLDQAHIQKLQQAGAVQGQPVPQQ